METQIAEFPLDETNARLEALKTMLPALNRSLLGFQKEVHISGSGSEKQDRQLMRKADHFAEQQFLEFIGSHFPEDKIICEEAGANEKQGNFQWWIDPVDGSRNFIHGLPLYAVSVGLCYREDPVAGLVSAPALSDTYHAISGLGAFKNGVPIEVSDVHDIERSLVAAGIPFRRQEILKDLLINLTSFLGTGSGLRRTGSVVLDLCWMAEGRFDALWERGLKPWDLCAAWVILREAGGRFSAMDGKHCDFFEPNIVASNGAIHSSVVGLLQKAGNVEWLN